MNDQIRAEIVADSVNPAGSRLTSFVVTFPRYILAEINTHRIISKNSASSRAIPTSKLLDMVRDHPVLPVRYGANQRGMQASDILTEENTLDCARKIRSMATEAAAGVEYLAFENNLHKQNANRYLEPFLPHTALLTASEWKNFFRLRAHPAAMPDIQVLAYRMLDLYLKHEPQELSWGQSHVPFGDRMDPAWTSDERTRVCIARCARLSYLTFEGEIDLEKDLALFEQLKASGHWSPFEHLATCIEGGVCDPVFLSNLHRTWLQYRKHFREEAGIFGTDLPGILAGKPDWITL